MDKIYLDNAAIEKPLKEVLDNLPGWYSDYYNSSAIYENASYNRRNIEEVREKIANFINAKPEQIIFCPSASIANTMAIDGFLNKNGYFSRALCSGYEHSSISMNPKVEITENINDYRYIYPKCLHIHTVANSVTGEIYDIKSISQKSHESGSYVFCDATAAFGKIPIDVKDLDIDMMSFTFQKIGGIVGCACLYLKDANIINPIIYGHQEYGMFGGTYNYPAIMAAGVAIDNIDFSIQQIIEEKRNYLIDKIILNKNITLNGDIKNRLPGNINVCIHNTVLNGQQIVGLLDIAGFMVSPGGSACNSGNLEPDPVLKAIGLSDEDAKNSIRITINEDITYEDLDKFCEELFLIIEMNKR